MKQFKFDLMTMIAFLILSTGAAWTWYSRVPPGATTTGKIPAPQKGFLAPEFTLQTADGQLISLATLRGHAVIVNIWASWCPPCRAEMPALQRVFQDYQDLGLQVLAVNSTIQDDRDGAIKFAKENHLTFPVLFDPQGQATSLYKVVSLPTTFFIDPQGIIREVVIGGPMAEALLRVRVDQLLENQPAGTP